jgi:RNA polymerase sigma-70 factor (ECF subfamily)
VGIYTSAGVTLEIPVKSTVTTEYILNNQPELRDSHHLDVPLQWSTGIGIGVQYNITPTIGIFAEPGVQYYIPDGSGFETYRTQHPFTITIPRIAIHVVVKINKMMQSLFGLWHHRL